SATLEHDILGFDYHQVGANLLQTWGFPDMLIETVRFWETPDELSQETEETTLRLCRIVQMADFTSQIVWFTSKEHALQILHDHGHQYFGLTDVEIDTCFVGLQNRLAETASLFDIEMASLVDFNAILVEARDQLVQLQP
ncbi:MAG: HDOD domain-containing protein, partial [bacterium]|nr:HDOD domain-containing protein [bacterium]